MANERGPLHETIRDILESNGKIEAIKALRARTGLDLATAKAAVEAIERGEADGGLAELPADDIEQRVLDCLVKDGKIAAIKLYRDATGAGLADAKQAVEALATERGIEPAPSGGCLSPLLFSIAIATAAALI